MFTKKPIIDSQKDEQESQFRMFALEGKVEDVRYCLDGGVEIDSVDNAGTSALMCASIEGHQEVLSLLNIRNANLDLQDDVGMTALMYCGFDSKKEESLAKVVEILLVSGANVNLVDNHNMTAMMRAACNGLEKVVNVIVETVMTSPKINDVEYLNEFLEQFNSKEVQFSLNEECFLMVAMMLPEGHLKDSMTQKHASTSKNEHDDVKILMRIKEKLSESEEFAGKNSDQNIAILEKDGEVRLSESQIQVFNRVEKEMEQELMNMNKSVEVRSFDEKSPSSILKPQNENHELSISDEEAYL